MASPREYAPESVDKRKKQGLELMETLREQFGDDEFSVKQIHEAMKAGEIRPTAENPDIESHNEETIGEMLEALQKDGLVESVERDGKTLYRFTMDGIRLLDEQRAA